MKKFMALIMRAIVEVKIIDIFTIEMINSHFVRNLDSGGMPAKLAMINKSSHFFTLFLGSVFKLSILKLFNKCIIIITEVQ